MRQMKTWFNNPVAVRQQILAGCQNQQYLQPAIVEKDWWVTTVLHALFQTSCAKHLIFKGGTSLSKGWKVIDRFSEDIDLALHRSFFGIEKTSKNQKEKLRKTGRKYIVDELSKELDQQLALMGISGYRVESVTTKTTRDGLVVPVDSDKDPTVINVYYDSVAAGAVPYAQTAVKIEISCISMDEPSEVRTISSLVEQTFPGEDKDVTSQIRTVVPIRTFLEKIFLLAEEFQKEKPRSIRMTRHLYDLERLMDTEFGLAALKDGELYAAIVKHRSIYYDLPYVDYQKHHPATISFLPPEGIIQEWEKDYGNMQASFIYGTSLPFSDLIARMRELQNRLRTVKTKDNLME